MYFWEKFNKKLSPEINVSELFLNGFFLFYSDQICLEANHH